MHDFKPQYYRLGSYFGARLHPDSKVIWMEDGKDRCKHCGYGVGYYPMDFFAPECKKTRGRFQDKGTVLQKDKGTVQKTRGRFYCLDCSMMKRQGDGSIVLTAQ